MRVTIFGSGYVGLVTGACLADAGNHVLCVDIDEAKIERLKRGEMPIHEPGLEPMVKRWCRSRPAPIHDGRQGRRRARFVSVHLRRHAAGRGRFGRSQVRAGRRAVDRREPRRTTGSSSTSRRCRSARPIVCAPRSKLPLRARGMNVEFDVASNPEFLKEGAAIEDFMKPDRIVIGTDNPRTAELLRALYDPFNRSHDRADRDGHTVRRAHEVRR